MAHGHPRLHPRLALWIENQQGNLAFGKGRMVILDAVERHGSLAAAATALGMSYRGLWARLRRSEECLGYPLVESHAGRGQSSGSVLTPQGRELLEGYRVLLDRVTAAADQAYREIFGPPGK